MFHILEYVRRLQTTAFTVVCDVEGGGDAAHSSGRPRQRPAVALIAASPMFVRVADVAPHFA